MSGELTCTVSGCGKPVQCKGLCPMHYQRQRKHGSLEKPPAPAPRTYGACAEGGCGSPAGKSGLCSTHYKRAWHLANYERTYAAAIARRNENRDEYLAKSQAYYRSKREEILARMAEKYAADPAPKRDSTKRWRAAHPMRVRQYELKRRALMRATRVEPVDYDAILAEFGMHCHICDSVIPSTSDLHFDHVIPLARGGTHTRDNIKPAHASCNIRKGARVA